MRKLGIFAPFLVGAFSACGGGASTPQPVAIPPAQGTLAGGGLRQNCLDAARRAWARRDPGAAGAARNLLAMPRDDQSPALTPLDGKALERARADFSTTLRIRRALLTDAELSLAAKSVKIVTSNGKVTLRGAALTEAERRIVEATARAIAGRDQVVSKF